MSPRFFWFLVVAALLLTPLALASLFTPRGADLPQPELAFPQLRPHEVASITLTFPRFMQGASQIRLEKNNKGRFTLPDASGFPVRPDLSDRVLKGMAGLLLVEPRTADPEFHVALGLRPPETFGRAHRVELASASGEVLAALLVGQEAPGSEGARRALFVRREGENQSWLAAPFSLAGLPALAHRWLWLDLPPAYAPESFAVLTRKMADGTEEVLAGEALAAKITDLTPLFDNARPAPTDFSTNLQLAITGKTGLVWLLELGAYEGRLWVRPEPSPLFGGDAWPGWIFRLAPQAASLIGARSFGTKKDPEGPKGQIDTHIKEQAQ